MDSETKQERSRTRWTASLDRIFVDLIVQQIQLGNRPNNVFDKKTWGHIRDEFNRQSGLDFNSNQLREHYDVLRIRYNSTKSAIDQNNFSIEDSCTIGFDLWESLGEVFSNPKNGKKIFSALLQILETQQSQLETLADERKRQEERIKVEYERWISGVRSLKGLIDQLRRQTKLSEMARLVEAAKTNLVFGLKMKQELVYKLKLENSEDELADFKEWFDILCHRCPTEKECPGILDAIAEERMGENGSTKAASTKKLNCRALEKEVKRLKCEYEKLSIKNSSEVSSLMSEKEFAWNQYREMESKYTTQLQAKNDEVSQVNARVGKLLETVEQLQLSSMEKDAEIADLKESLAKMGAEASSNKDGEVSRMLEESEPLTKSKGGLLTPVLRGCTTGRKAKHGSRRTCVSRFCTAEPKAKALILDDEHGSRKTTRSGKRKPFSSQENRSETKRRVTFEVETPKLFTSDFKIPKLKCSSSLL